MNETTIKAALYAWLSASLGLQQTFTITFSADLVTGNTVNASFDAIAIPAVAFSGTHAATLAALADKIMRTAPIFTAYVTGAREITCVGAVYGHTVVIVGPTVTGGASQAVATVATTTAAQAVKVGFADQKPVSSSVTGNAPRLLYPYATIRIMDYRRVGWDGIRMKDLSNNIANIGGQRQATVRVECFGNNAVSMASQAVTSLSKRTVLDLLSVAGVAVQDKNPVQNLTAMLETVFEERAVFDFNIGLADSVEDDLGVIEKVELAGEIDDFEVDLTVEV